MHFEINNERTPPAVMLSMSQSRSTPVLEFGHSTSPFNPPRPIEQFKDISNLKVNQRRSRSFTPSKGSLYLHSPELSPIDATINRDHAPPIDYQPNSCETPILERSLSPCDYKLEQSLTPMEFKVPQRVKPIDGTTPNRPAGRQQHHNHHNKIRQQQTEKSQYEDPNQTQSLDKSASHGYLNHKLDVRLILKNAGMQKYIAAFDKEKMDFGNFLSLCEEDLLRLGVKRKVDRNVILSIINDLNIN